MALQMNLTTDNIGTIDNTYIIIFKYEQVKNRPTLVTVRYYISKEKKEENANYNFNEKYFQVTPSFPANSIEEAIYNGLKNLDEFSLATDILEDDQTLTTS